MINGKKTYIVAGVMVVRALYPLVVGDISVDQFIDGPFIQELLTALGIGSLRHGIAKK